VVVGRGIFDRLSILEQLGLMPPLSTTQTPVGRAVLWAAVNKGLVGRAAAGAAVGGLALLGLRRALRRGRGRK
jgi:hypothetical protein